MKDSDPRPMPPEVQTAHGGPADLVGLLKTDIYSDADRVAVRDELLRILIDRHGDPRVQIGNYSGIFEEGAVEARNDARQASFSRLADLTRRLIAPSLIADAVRPAGRLSARSAALPAAIGAALGATAVYLAKRA